MREHAGSNEDKVAAEERYQQAIERSRKIKLADELQPKIDNALERYADRMDCRPNVGDEQERRNLAAYLSGYISEALDDCRMSREPENAKKEIEYLRKRDDARS